MFIDGGFNGPEGINNRRSSSTRRGRGGRNELSRSLPENVKLSAVKYMLDSGVKSKGRKLSLDKLSF